MYKNSIKVQNRGKGRRLTARNVENLSGGIEELRISLGIINQPETPFEEQSGENSFGLEEVLAGIGIIALAGIVNVCY